MSSRTLKTIFPSLIFFLSALPAQATNSLGVVINEIAWMGTETSYNDEWIELYNNTGSPINLEGWILKATDGAPEINLAGAIPSFGYYLLERTDDNAVPNIMADQIYTGALSNKGEYLKLSGNDNNLIDEINCGEGWFAGDNKTKQTMEKADPSLLGSHPGNWWTSQSSGGTPKAKNGLLILTEPETELVPKSQEISKPISYASGIVINEILPSPEGPDAEEEWIEILNRNSFEVNVSFWQIRDIVGKTKTYTFPEETKISPYDFLVLFRPKTRITLNNDGDGLNLIQPNGNIIDTIFWEKAPLAESYNRTEAGWVWNNILTPGSQNITQKEGIDLEQQLKTEEKLKPKAPQPKEELAVIAQQIPEKPSLFPLSVALAVAIFSGAIILILKNKIKKVDLLSKMR